MGGAVNEPFDRQQQQLRAVFRIADEPAHDAVRIALRVLAGVAFSRSIRRFAFRSGAREKGSRIFREPFYLPCRGGLQPASTDPLTAISSNVRPSHQDAPRLMPSTRLSHIRHALYALPDAHRTARLKSASRR